LVSFRKGLTLNRVLVSPLKPPPKKIEEEEGERTVVRDTGERTVVRDTAFITEYFLQRHGLEYSLAVPSFNNSKCIYVGGKVKPSEVLNVRW